MFKSFFQFLPAALLLLVFTACDDNNLVGPDTDAPPTLSVRLIDAPGNYEKVLIDVADVQVRYDDGAFTSLQTSFAGVYDLLTLTNGVDTTLGQTIAPVGVPNEVRLILGENNQVQLDGELRDLQTPSAQQSGLKVRVQDADTLLPGRTYELTVDFDAGRSIVCAGNSGRLNLKPVLRAYLREVDNPVGGTLAGTLNPAEGQYVQAIRPGVDTLGSFVTGDGLFSFSDLPAATYELYVEAPATAAYQDTTLRDIVIVSGQTTDLGVIDLD